MLADDGGVGIALLQLLQALIDGVDELFRLRVILGHDDMHAARSERSLHHLEELRQPKLPEGITSLKIAGDEGVGLALLREAYAIEKRGPPDHGNPSLRKPFAAIAVQD